MHELGHKASFLQHFFYKRIIITIFSSSSSSRNGGDAVQYSDSVMNQMRDARRF